MSVKTEVNKATKTYWPKFNFVVKTFVAVVIIGLVTLLPMIGTTLSRIFSNPGEYFSGLASRFTT